jgi:hypothetical protein
MSTVVNEMPTDWPLRITPALSPSPSNVGRARGAAPLYIRLRGAPLPTDFGDVTPIDEELFNIALSEWPLLAQSGHWLTSTDGGGFDVVKKTKDLNVPWRLARISHASYVGADDRLGRGRKIGIARLVIGLLPATAYFADAARRAGLKVVVNMSQVSAREDSKSYAARDHWIAERLFEWSGVPTVHLRPTFLLWGYGTRDELEGAGADQLVESTVDLACTVLAMVSGKRPLT